MGYVFEANDVTFWSPSLNVGRVVLSQLTLLESLVEAPSGLQQIMSDTVAVDLMKLRRFVTKVIETDRLDNKVLQLCFAGLMSVLLAMLIFHEAAPDGFAEHFDTNVTTNATVLAKRHMQQQ